MSIVVSPVHTNIMSEIIIGNKKLSPNKYVQESSEVFRVQACFKLIKLVGSLTISVFHKP